ncbi:MAG: hypothetical protein JST40_04230 [Armatimonadetes bacterium]|nr:hypothetical protein [Armatimonadota bacterium]
MTFIPLSATLRKTIESKLPVHRLKSCPLCGTLNAEDNESCFSCGWHGTFVRDPEQIRQSLHELVLDCPEIGDILTQRVVGRPSLIQRMLGIFRRDRKRLDISV